MKNMNKTAIVKLVLLCIAIIFGFCAALYMDDDVFYFCGGASLTLVCIYLLICLIQSGELRVKNDDNITATPAPKAVDGTTTIVPKELNENDFMLIERLKKLYDMDAITQEEFDIKRRQVLGL